MNLINNLFLTIIPCLLNAGIILYILLILPRSKTTGLFNLFVFSLFLWQLETIILNFSTAESTVIFWDKTFSIGWISCAPLLLHFSLKFTGAKTFLKSWSLLLIYLPFAVFHQLHIARENVHFTLNDQWGWIQHSSPGSSEAILRYCMALYVLVAVSVLLRHSFLKRNDKRKKMQAYMIALGISIPAIQGIITQVVYPFFLHQDEIPLTTTFLTFFSAATLIAFRRYSMFNIAESINVETVLTNLKNIVLFISPEKKILYMNPYSTRLLAFTQDWQDEEIHIERIFSTPAHYDDFINKVFPVAMKGEIVKKYTTAFAINENDKIDVLISIKPVINNNKVEGMLLVGNDITEQVKTIKALEHSNERFNIVCKATNDMVWEWNLVTSEVYRNKEGWKKLFNTFPESEFGTPDNWDEMVHPEDREKMCAIKEEICNSTEQDFFEIESRIIRKDGSLAYIHDRGFVVRDESGRAVRLIGAAQDITGRKLAEKKLMEEQIRKQHEITDAVIQAQEKERQKIGGELHDNVNQILASSLLYLNLARTQEKNRTEIYNKVDGLITEAIQEIRRLSHSIIPPSLNGNTLSGALENLVDTARLSAVFEVKTDIDGFIESGVPEKLKLTIYRIVQEQFNNIIKYASATVVELKLKNKNGEIFLSLSDNGKGFDPTQRSRGVGLMNISSRASLHKGTVKILSAPGEGCILQVHFPKQNAEPIELQPDTILLG